MKKKNVNDTIKLSLQLNINIIDIEIFNAYEQIKKLSETVY